MMHCSRKAFTRIGQLAVFGIIVVLIAGIWHFSRRPSVAPSTTMSNIMGSQDAERVKPGQAPLSTSITTPEMAEQIRLHWAIKNARTPEEFETAKAAWRQGQQQHPPTTLRAMGH